MESAHHVTPLRASPIYGQHVIVSPSVPFTGAIRRLQVGEAVILKGAVASKTSGFTIELQFALPNGQVERILHISVRFERKEIVRNTMLSGAWGPEERFGGLPDNLHRGKNFQCFLLVQDNQFKVAFNRKHYCDYRHRTNVGSVNRLHVSGGATLHSIHFQPGPASRMARGVANAMPMIVANKDPESFKDFPCKYGMETPYFEYIPGGMVPHRYLYVCGKMHLIARRFHVNLLVGNSRTCKEYALHMDVRFDDPDTNGGGKNVVCNTRLHKKWGKEERLECDFPFQLGVHFDILIAVTVDAFLISVNNEHLVRFNHRWTDLERIKGVEIDGDVMVIHARLH